MEGEVIIVVFQSRSNVDGRLCRRVFSRVEDNVKEYIPRSNDIKQKREKSSLIGKDSGTVVFIMGTYHPQAKNHSGEKRKVLGNGRQILRLGYKPLLPSRSNQLDPPGRLSSTYKSS